MKPKNATTRKTPRRKARRTKFKEVHDSPFPYFVRFPPKDITLSLADSDAGRFPPLTVMTDLRRNRSDFEAGVDICGELREYQESRDLVAMLTAFNTAVRAGVYPPVEILQQLEVAFDRYVTGKGKITMDQALNLVGKKGEWSAFMKRSQRQDQKFVATLLYQAKIVFHESTEKAAARVANALQYHPAVEISYTEDSLIKKYSAWKKRFRLNENDRSCIDHPDNPHLTWDAARRQRFLSEPDYSLF